MSPSTEFTLSLKGRRAQGRQLNRKAVKKNLSLRQLGDHSREIKALAALRLAKNRRRSGRFIVEGVKSIITAFGSGFPLRGLYLSEGFWQGGNAGELAAKAESSGVPLCLLSERAFRRLSDLPSPQGALAVADLPRPPGSLGDFCRGKQVLAALEEVQDPGNVGAVIRTARAAGFKGLILCEGCADPYSSKAVRGSAGAVFGLPLYTEAKREQIASMARRGGYGFYGGVARGGMPPWKLAFKKPLLLLVGSEGSGLSEEMKALCRGTVTIPMDGEVGSLNVAVAFGVIAMEIARQGKLKP